MATGTEPCSNEPGAPGEIRVLAPGWSPTASIATRAVYMRHAATLSSQRKSGHKSSDRERGQHAIPRRVKAVLPFRAKRLWQALSTGASSDADLMEILYYLRAVKHSQSLAYPPRLTVELGSYVDGEAHEWAR